MTHLPHMESWQTHITQKKQLTADTWELHVAKPDGFRFLAGQFIQFFIPKDGGVAKRTYSIASAPAAEDIELCVAYFQGGVASTFFATTPIGEAIDFEGPAGRFIVPDDQPVLQFIATGTGIGPELGMIADALSSKNVQSVHLLFGVRYEEDIFWKDSFDALTQQFPQFSYHITLSKPNEAWRGLSGRVTSHLSFHKHAAYFLCGGPEMVKEVAGLLERENIPKSAVHFEIF